MALKFNFDDAMDWILSSEYLKTVNKILDPFNPEQEGIANLLRSNPLFAPPPLQAGGPSPQQFIDEQAQLGAPPVATLPAILPAAPLAPVEQPQNIEPAPEEVASFTPPPAPQEAAAPDPNRPQGAAETYYAALADQLGGLGGRAQDEFMAQHALEMNDIRKAMRFLDPETGRLPINKGIGGL